MMLQFHRNWRVILAPHKLHARQMAHFSLPQIRNEPMLSYSPDSAERRALDTEIDRILQSPAPVIPLVINGKSIFTTETGTQLNPSDIHAQKPICTYSIATAEHVKDAIAASLTARAKWAQMPWMDRASIFLKAADLAAGPKYKPALVASTMLGQGKNTWQAEIDAGAELQDFLRFGVKFADQLYSVQPTENSVGVWNKMEYRPLEGFVLALSPFNFTAIAANLVCAPAMLGNVVIWKPSDGAILSNYIIFKILEEAGLPKGVINFLPGPPAVVASTAISSPDLAALHFTGSTQVFKKLYGNIGANIANGTYKSYPRIVGETGGKNFHLVHSSAAIVPTVIQTIRAAFEYQGQKCSALSRLFVPRSLWNGGFKSELVARTDALQQGTVTDHSNFCGPVVNAAAYMRIKTALEDVGSEGKVIAGGTFSDDVGYFVRPTIVEVNDLDAKVMTTELFGPVLAVFVYEDAEYEDIARAINKNSFYALTGAIFAKDRDALRTASDILRDAAGNMYINEKCTGAVVGQQPFGGGRMSGTNDKAGSIGLLYRFVSGRCIKEGWIAPTDVEYENTDSLKTTAFLNHQLYSPELISTENDLMKDTRISLREPPKIEGLILSNDFLSADDESHFASQALRCGLTPSNNQLMMFGRRDGSFTEWPWLDDLLQKSEVLFRTKYPLKVDEMHILFAQKLPRQAIVNLYVPGQGISAHIDLPHKYSDGIFAISLCSGISMRFQRDNFVSDVWLERGCALFMSGECRYKWTHAILEADADLVVDEHRTDYEWPFDDEVAQDEPLSASWIPRGTRISVTFRYMLPSDD